MQRYTTGSSPFRHAIVGIAVTICVNKPTGLNLYFYFN